MDDKIIPLGLTFDDVLLLPAYSSVLPTQVKLESKLTDRISLPLPLISSAMDTVTESALAIVMALCGGLGIIHKNMPVNKQADEVKKVKLASPSASPIRADFDPASPHSTEEKKSNMHPMLWSYEPARDQNGALRVGAAVGVNEDGEERAEALAEAGADVLVVDTAHGHSESVINTIRTLSKRYTHIDIVGGNIATREAALSLVEAGAAAVKVGIGPGSICTTRIVSGVGVPQISALFAVSEALEKSSVCVIADGGVRYSGDVAKALAAGAHVVMLGSLLAGTKEAPGEVLTIGDQKMKRYRGMGSLTAMALGSRDRYGQSDVLDSQKLVPEGVEALTPYKGELSPILYRLSGGLRSAMGYTGAKTIHELRTQTKFVRQTASGLQESHVHDVKLETDFSPRDRSH